MKIKKVSKKWYIAQGIYQGARYQGYGSTPLIALKSALHDLSIIIRFKEVNTLSW